MLDHAPILLPCPWQETRNINKCKQWNFKCVTKADKPCSFARTVNIKTASQHQRLVGHDANSLPLKTDKARDYVFGKLFLNLVKIALICELKDQLLHIIGRIGVFWHKRIETHILAIHTVKEGTHWRLLTVGKWQEVDQAAHLSNRFDIILKSAVRNRRFLGMCRSPPKLFSGDLLVGYRFHNIRPSDKHIRAVFDHEDKIGHRRRVNSATSARPHNQADLRHNA